MPNMVELIGYDGSEGDNFYVGDDGLIYEVGDDGEIYEVGARHRKVMRKQRQQARRAPKQVALKKLPPARRASLDPSEMRRQIVGVTMAAPILAGATGSVSINIQRDFQGQRVVLSAFDTVANAEVNSAVTLSVFLIGSVNQLPASQPIGLVAFRADAIDSFMSLTPASPGVLIQMSFVNNSANPVVVSGGIYGMTHNA